MKTKRISALFMVALACGASMSGSAEGAVVLDQIGDVSVYDFGAPPGPTPSQIFPDFPDFDCAVLEDFTVSSTELKITRVAALFWAQAGYSSFQSVQSYQLNIFSDVNLATVSLTGDVASFTMSTGSGMSVIPINNSDPYGVLSMEVDIALPVAGTYWVGVSPKSSVTEDRFFLLNSGAAGAVTPGNMNARLANPGQGFEVGALSLLDLDYAYSVTAVPEPAAMTLWIIGGCGLLCRRQRAGPAADKS